MPTKICMSKSKMGEKKGATTEASYFSAFHEATRKIQVDRHWGPDRIPFDLPVMTMLMTPTIFAKAEGHISLWFTIVPVGKVGCCGNRQICLAGTKAN